MISPRNQAPTRLQNLIFIAFAAAMVGAFLIVAARGRTGEAGVSWSEIQAEIDRRFPEVRSIGTAELAAWLDDRARARPLVIDVRAAAEFDVSHLPGAQHAEKIDDVVALLKTIPADRPVVVYCSVGWRSAVIADALRKRGRADVWNLRGSIFQWANEGRPLVRDGQPVRVVHPFDRKWGALLHRDLWPREFSP